MTGPQSAVEDAFVAQRDGSESNAMHKSFHPQAPMRLTPALSEAGAVITGLSAGTHVHTHSVRKILPANRYSTSGPYWFTDLKQAYNWPSYTKLSGRGVTIGILMSGGYKQSDMDAYFGNEGLVSPVFSEIKVLGGAPFDAEGGSFETTLDLQQAGGMAPNSDIVLYNLPDLSDDSIIAGLSQIVSDNKADVVSMSFGAPELLYTAAYNNGTDYTKLIRLENELLEQGSAQGITFVASSGDSGALSAPPSACFTGGNLAPCGSFEASVEFPASSPHVTGTGGTNLATTHKKSSLSSLYQSEEAYEDSLGQDIFYGTAAVGGVWGSGGGDSTLFMQPTYQSLIFTGNDHARTVPDIALHMGGCPSGSISCNPEDSADVEILDGEVLGTIGTSAAAPAFAGLTALNVERQGFFFVNENY